MVGSDSEKIILIFDLKNKARSGFVRFFGQAGMNVQMERAPREHDTFRCQEMKSEARNDK